MLVRTVYALTPRIRLLLDIPDDFALNVMCLRKLDCALLQWVLFETHSLLWCGYVVFFRFLLFLLYSMLVT